MAAQTRRWLGKTLSAFATIIPFGTARADDTKLQSLPASPSLDTLRDAFPFDIITTTGAKALDEWTQLKTAGKGWPIVIGSDDDLRMMLDAFSFANEDKSQTPADILKAADALILPKDLKTWQAAYGYGEMDESVGEWPANIQAGDMGLSTATDILTDKLFDKVYIILVPTSRSWEIPAYLRWGGWNACPPPEYHVAILKSWHERFGVELAGLNGDVMNLKVAKPLRDKDQAMAVAREQYLYCADIVDQGVGDISTLAATLIGQGWWYFWWD